MESQYFSRPLALTIHTECHASNAIVLSVPGDTAQVLFPSVRKHISLEHVAG